MNKQIESKLIRDGYKIWTVQEKGIVRIYIGDAQKFLDIEGDSYSKEFTVNSLNYSDLCLNGRRMLIQQHRFSQSIKVYYDCTTEQFAYFCSDKFYTEITETIIAKLNKKYNTESINDEESITSESSVKTTTTTVEEECDDKLCENNTVKLYFHDGRSISIESDEETKKTQMYKYITLKIKNSIKDLLNEEFKTSEHIAETLDEDNYSTYELSLIELYNLIVSTEKKTDNKLNELKEKAKITGIKQEYKKWSEDCNDEDEDCGLDVVVEYVLPDGSFEIERNHTY